MTTTAGEKKNKEKQKSADEKRKKIEAQKKAEADKKLEEQGNVAKKRKKLGINVQDVTPEIANFLGLKNEDGVVISAVNPGEPAEKGGLKSRDVILELNGKKIKDVKSMLKAMTDSSIKNKADVKVWRDKKIKTFTVNLGEDTQKKYMERGKVEEKNKLKSTEQFFSI